MISIQIVVPCPYLCIYLLLHIAATIRRGCMMRIGEAKYGVAQGNFLA
jgi:hypothetical protein